MRYAKGVMWLDDCRIPTDEILGREQKSSHNYAMLQGGYNDGFWDNTKGLGRFTPSLLVCDDMLNDGSIGIGKKSIVRSKKTQTIYGGGKGIPPLVSERGFDDKGTNSRYYDLDKWFDKVIDEIR